MPALRDDQAELERRPEDLIGERRLAPFPCSPFGRGQRHKYVGVRHPEPIRPEAVREGPDTNMSDMTQRGGRGMVQAERVGDVLSVSPRFHDPGGECAGRVMSGPYHGTRTGIDSVISANRFLDWSNQVLISGPDRLR